MYPRLLGLIEVLVIPDILHPSLLFAGKARCLPVGAPFRFVQALSSLVGGEEVESLGQYETG
jgi:hypothetical protein